MGMQYQLSHLLRKIRDTVARVQREKEYLSIPVHKIYKDINTEVISTEFQTVIVL